MSRPTSKRPSKHSNRRRRPKRGLKRYWLIALPAIILNAVVTLDHVIAKSNENAFHAKIRAVGFEAVNAPTKQDDAPLSETLRAHWISTNEDGDLEGRISAIEISQSSAVPIERLDVTLLKRGQKIRTATTDNNGRFVLKDVEPDVYTLLAAGQNGFLAYGVHVLPKLDDFEILNKNTNVDQKKLKQAYYVSHFNVPQDSVVVESLQIDAAAVPPEFTTLRRISQDYLPAATAFGIGVDDNDAKAIDKATGIRGGFQHPLSDDGSFEGRIQPIASDDGQASELSDMNLFLIQDDIETARVAVEKNGKFKIDNVDPGVYSLIAAGDDGFAALSLELVEESTDDQTSTNGKTKAHYVSNRAINPKNKRKAPLGIAIVTDPRDIQVIKQEVNRIDNERRQGLAAAQNGGAPFVDQGIAQGGFAPSSGFAPGGVPVGSSTGGFAPTGPVGSGAPVSAGPVSGSSAGRLLGIAGLAVGITAVASNNGGAVDPGPASPFAPGTN